MSKKMRHSKFRNTGILWELLTRQITADIIAGKEISEARDLLFKYFNENTELGKEWRLYNFLLTEKIKDDNHAERFLTVILEQRKKLSSVHLTQEKYELIKEIKSLYPIDEFLKGNIRNYRTNASIFKLFEDISSKDVKFDVSEIYQAKTCIVEHVVDRPKKTITNNEDDLMKLYSQQSEDIRLLSYQFLVEKLNDKYEKLDENQKSIIREYINNVSNTNSLNTFITGKLASVRLELNELATKVKNDDVIKIKINEVVKQLDNVKPGKTVKDNQIMVVLLSYELLKEVKHQIAEKV